MHLSPLWPASLILLIVTQANAAPITFGFAADPEEFVASYAGFIWSGEGGSNSLVNGTVVPLVPAPTFPPPPPVAPLGYAWSNDGDAFSMSLAAPGTFTFDSIALYADAALWSPGAVGPGILTIDGWLNGSIVDTYTTPILDSLPRGLYTTFDFDWSGIDTVTFAGPYPPGGNENVVITDVTVDDLPPIPASVPEPSTLTLLMTTVCACVALRVWKIKENAARPSHFLPVQPPVFIGSAAAPARHGRCKGALGLR